MVAASFAVVPAAHADPAWTVTPSANPSGAARSFLYGVDCPRTTSCFAVGTSDTKALIEHWNGSAWTIMPGPRPVRSFLNDVSCPTGGSCFAVGTRGASGGADQSFMLHWNGTRWATMTAPHATGWATVGIDCPGPKNCYAVGHRPRGEESSNPLAQHWDGRRWTNMVAPVPPYGGFFSSVSCPTANNCVAAGGRNRRNSIATDTFVQRWDGKHWTTLSTVTPPGPPTWVFVHFTGVSCASTTRCVAVGYRQSSGFGFAVRPLVEHWNGSRWTVASGTMPPGQYLRASLSDVSCPTATNCFAVGVVIDATGGPGTTLVEHWDGSAWSIVDSPNPSTADTSALESVACISTTECAAVGWSSVADLPATYSTLGEAYG